MLISGVPKNQRWWLWAFALWIFFSLGPGLALGSQAFYIGYFPFLYVWSFIFWIFAVILAWILAYKLDFHEVSTDITPMHGGE
jgi:hypothetical protein